MLISHEFTCLQSRAAEGWAWAGGEGRGGQGRTGEGRMREGRTREGRGLFSARGVHSRGAIPSWGHIPTAKAHKDRSASGP